MLVILVVSLLVVTGAALLWPVRGASGSAGPGRAKDHEGESRSVDES
ncbi:hypothetical protein [Nocardia cyriacigeorgica]|nr:hypothetical protein [Nocardia cyriacigeorgica]